MSAFLVDQQLPRALAIYLTERGHDARHIKDHPGGATMPDQDVAHLADSEDRFVVTKDEDFRISHLLASHRRGYSTLPAATSPPVIFSPCSTGTGRHSSPRSRPTTTWRSTTRA